MPLSGWNRLLADAEWCRGAGRFPIRAYSEFVPPPYVALKPYGPLPCPTRDPRDNWGWYVAECEQVEELRPGLRIVAREVLKEVVKLGRGEPTPQIPRRELENNPYWPANLAGHAGRLTHERYVILASLALSRTQDDKGRVRWTLFGGSEQGPGRAFWEGFFTGPKREAPADQGQNFLGRLLETAYGVRDRQGDLRRLGLRVLPTGPDPDFPYWGEERFPGWCQDLLWRDAAGLKGVKYLLTFRAFARLPAEVQQAYLDGRLHLLPFPGSLVFWGSLPYRWLDRQMPGAVQTPILQLFPRYRDISGLRIPQTGWLDEKAEGGEDLGPLNRPRLHRTHRFQRAARDTDETIGRTDDPVTKVLFSTAPEDLGLYGKPMACNARAWGQDYMAVLDGPRLDAAHIRRAADQVNQGGRFGYRLVFPAMRVGPWEVMWHRPLAALPGADVEHPTVLEDAPLGFLTATPADDPDPARPVVLWPRFLDRPLYREAAELFEGQSHPRKRADAFNARAILEQQEYREGRPVPRTLARACVKVANHDRLRDWLEGLPRHASDAGRARALAAALARAIEPADEELPADPLAASLTFASTCSRSFETAYWKTIVRLSHGRFAHKNTAGLVQDPPTRKALGDYRSHLHTLGDHLIRCHRRAIEQAGLTGQAWVAEQPFRWESDFDMDWMGSLARNREGKKHERNLLVRIPGRDPSQAVILADHYDTAFMYDRYLPKYGGTGARVAAPGADDNHSATALLLLAAPIFLQMSKARQLACDVWLVHLTGEEFPADCLGSRALCRALVEGSLKVREPAGPGERDGRTRNLSKVRARGVYDVDMIAHNNPHEPYVFQISPGEGPRSAWLAREAHQANVLWNALARRLNGVPPRKGLGAGTRVKDPKEIPPVALHAELRGEVRTEWDPRSTLYNTDGQIFSDAGVPVVLFMEDYDINREGYHDTHDTVENLDLDYGAALAAIIIETVARAASAPE